MKEKEEIKKGIKKSIEAIQERKEWPDFPIPEIVVERPKDNKYGDYSTPVSASVAKIIGEDPYIVAQKIKNQFQTYNTYSVRETIAAKPAFDNFYLSNEVFINNVKKILREKDNFGKNKNLKNNKIIIEYTDPNPFKEFHIGHLMSNSIGESMSRILEFQGAKIKRANYQGDVGLHVAKAIWGILHVLKNNFPKDGDSLNRKIVYLGNAYVVGAGAYDENDLSGSLAGGPTKKEMINQIKEINKKIFDKSDKEINRIYDKGKKWSMEHFDEIYKKLSTKFDYYFFESESAYSGKKIVEKNIGEIFERGENGAIIFPGEKYGLHTRVFVNSEGLPTYEAKELALAEIKRKKFKYDKSIVVTANEINEYFKVILSAMRLIFPDLAEKTEHIGHGMMKLSEGKMSSRTGRVISFDFLFGEVKKMVLEKVKKENFTEKEKQNIAEKVAVGALKYSILKQSIGNDIIYNPEKSISFEGDSGPYLQYSYARAKSVLRKAQKEQIKSDPNLRIHPNNPNNLERMMVYFPEIVEKASEKRAPHRIATYLTELAREFNNFYAKEKIVDKNDKSSPYKIALTEAFSIIMKNGLWLLGIETLEKM